MFSPEKLHLIEVKYVKGQIEEPENFDPSAVESAVSDVELKVGFNLAEGFIKVDFFVSIKTILKIASAEPAEASFHLAYIFKVDDIYVMVKEKEGNELEVDSGLGNALSSVTYSTTRGVLLVRLQGTAFNGYILPIIDPNLLNKK